MKITNHLLEGVRHDIFPGGKDMSIRRAVVIHFTSGASAASSIDFWKEPAQRKNDIGAHIVIDRDGTMTQCRAFDKTMSHAGVSRWKDPKTGTLYKFCNGFTIGIELANAGNDPSVQRKVISMGKGCAGVSSPLKHRNGGASQAWELYPTAQLDACAQVVQALCAAYHLDDITGHDCIAPERKDDPGPAFPMEKLRESCGFAGLPAVHLPV